MKINQEILVEALIKERDELIKNNPELAEFQSRIDSELDDITEPLERAAKVNQMLLKMLSEKLLPAMNKLREIESEVKILEFKSKKQKAA